MTKTRLHLVATALSAFLLLIALPSQAQRLTPGQVRIAITYDISIARPDTQDKLEGALRIARNMAYKRVRDECIDLKNHLAKSCTLSSLNIRNNSRRTGRRGAPDTINVKASATFLITLKNEMQPASGAQGKSPERLDGSSEKTPPDPTQS